MDIILICFLFSSISHSHLFAIHFLRPATSLSSATSLSRATSLQNYLKVQPHIHNRVEAPSARSAKSIAHTGTCMGTQIDSATEDLRPAINGYGTYRITRAARTVSPEAQIKGRIPKAGRHAVTGHRYAQPVTGPGHNPKRTELEARVDSRRRSCDAHRERTVAPRSELNRHVRAQTRKLQQVGRNGHALSRCLPGKKKAGKAQEHYRFHYAIHLIKNLCYLTTKGDGNCGHHLHSSKICQN